MIQTKIYKIAWYDSTSKRLSKTIFPNYRVIKKEGEKTTVLAWDFIDARPEKLKEYVIKWLKNYPRQIDWFVVSKKFKSKIVLTRKDL